MIESFLFSNLKTIPHTSSMPEKVFIFIPFFLLQRFAYITETVKNNHPTKNRKTRKNWIVSHMNFF